MRLVALGLLLVPLTACTVHSGARRSVYRTSTSIEAKGATAIVIENTVGSVRVLPALDTEVNIDLDVRLDELRPESDATKNVAAHLHVGNDGGRIHLADVHAGAADSNDWELRLIVRVPAGLSITVSQTAGAVDVEAKQCGALSVDNSNGSVSARLGTASGPIELHGSTGQVVAVITGDAAAGASLSVANGQASLSLPDPSKGEFDLTVGTGGLVVAPRFGLKIARTMTGGVVHGTVGGGGPAYRVEVGTGELVLK